MEFFGSFVIPEKTLYMVLALVLSLVMLVTSCMGGPKTFASTSREVTSAKDDHGFKQLTEGGQMVVMENGGFSFSRKSQAAFSASFFDAK